MYGVYEVSTVQALPLVAIPGGPRIDTHESTGVPSTEQPELGPPRIPE